MMMMTGGGGELGFSWVFELERGEVEKIGVARLLGGFCFFFVVCSKGKTVENSSVSFMKKHGLALFLKKESRGFSSLSLCLFFFFFCFLFFCCSSRHGGLRAADVVVVGRLVHGGGSKRRDCRHCKGVCTCANEYEHHRDTPTESAKAAEAAQSLVCDLACI